MILFGLILIFATQVRALFFNSVIEFVEDTKDDFHEIVQEGREFWNDVTTRSSENVEEQNVTLKISKMT